VNFVEQIAADMAALTPATRKAIRPKLREAGQAIADDAKANASWSTRIPATIRVMVSFRDSREGVTISAGGPSAPHARPYEDVTGKGKFRHPVFPDSANLTRKAWSWVDQASRPFLLPAAQANEGTSYTALRTALDEAAREIGFGG
jgi:hypothetical protein